MKLPASAGGLAYGVLFPPVQCCAGLSRAVGELCLPPVKSISQKHPFSVLGGYVLRIVR